MTEELTVETPTEDTVSTELHAGAMGLPALVMQGITAIAPAFALLAVFQFSVSLAGVVAPLTFTFAFLVILMLIGSVSQLAKVFPSAGGWYTWIGRGLHPRAGFMGAMMWTLWLPPVTALTTSYLAYAVLEPSIKQQYSVTIPWWVFVIVVGAIVFFFCYSGIVLSERLLIITGLVEIVIMLALGVSGLLSPGNGGFNFQPFNPGNLSHAPNLWLAFVFSIFAFSGWEAVAPLAEESRNPRRNVPLGLLLAASLYAAYLLFMTWSLLIGSGTANPAKIASATAFPGFTLAVKVWHGAWVIVLFALLNSAIAVSIATFNASTRVFYAMGRSGTLPELFGKINPKRQTPDNAAHLTVVFNLAAFGFAIAFGPANVFFTWSLAITFGLILLYVLANIAVMKYYFTVKRSEFNPLFHLIFPLVSSAAVLIVAYKSVVPLPAAPEKYAPFIFLGVVALGVLILIYLRLARKEEFLEATRQAMS